MTRSIGAVAFTVGLVSLLFPALVVAQQKYQYSHATPPQSSRYVQQHIIDVDDMAGHQIRILEVQRKYTSDHPLIAGVKVIETWDRGFSDYTNGIGPAQGYGTWVLEDGNTLFTKWSGSSSSKTTSTVAKEGIFTGTTYLLGGTGKFATIRGVLAEKSEFNTDPDNGYNYTSSQGEYWFAE